MNPNDTDTPSLNVRTRFARVWLPGAMAVGALGALVAASLRFRPAPKSAQPSAGPLVRPTGTPGSAAGADTPGPPAGAATPGSSVGVGAPGSRAGAVAPGSSPLPVVPARTARVFERSYLQTSVLGGATSSDVFRQSLVGIAVGATDRVFALGDDEVRVFDAQLRRVRTFRVPEHASCLAVGPEDRVYIGSAGRVDTYDAGGNLVAGFAAGGQDKPADVTALAVFGDDVLVADAQARIIRRFGLDGTPRGIIGDQVKTRSFILPNRSLDLAVDSGGIVYATDSGRHQVTEWALDGSPRGKFGKFGMLAPDDFVGCCNPVNIAVTPDGKVVTAEKMVARVKVYEPDGTLLAVIGPENFDPACTHIYVTVDSNGRILAADPVRREVKVFSRNQL
jgi:hypothetical protein